MSKTLRLITTLGVVTLATGCAGVNQWASGRDWRAYDRGHTYAFGHCSGCHTIAGDAPSPTPAAPPFATVANRYDDKTLGWDLETIATTGHYGMPRTPIEASDRADLTAYIIGLNPDATRAFRAAPRPAVR